jgi:hypothetical protein
VLNGESEGAWGLKMGDESNYGVVAAVSGSFEGSVGSELLWGFSLFRKFVYDLDRTCLVACFYDVTTCKASACMDYDRTKTFSIYISVYISFSHLKSNL